MRRGASRNEILYLLILVLVGVLLFSMFSSPKAYTEVPLSTVAQWLKDGEVEELIVSDGEVKVKKAGSTRLYMAYKEIGVSVTETLSNLGVPQEKLAQVKIVVEKRSRLGEWVTVLGGLLPLIFVAALFYFLMRQAQGANNQAFSFGKSRARLFTTERPTVTFDDVAGVDEAKEELKEVVEFLREPQKFAALGARIPKGVLLVGPPGTGKTLLAKAVAGEAGVPFFSISGSEFVEMFVGVGAARVRDLFDQAKRHSPCIVFIDEIDAVGRYRGAGLGGSHDEREQTLNQILVEMDGFDTDTNVIVMAATNRPDILDPALLRPGRFDRRVVLDRPDVKGRRAILEVHVRNKPLDKDVDLDVLARETPGFVGADIENMVNEAAILAARRNKKAIGMREFQEAIERVIAGPERKSRIISEEERRIIAYHEAGHALVMHHLPNCDPVHKISIIARGMALGYTMPLPEEDRYLQRKSKFLDDLSGLLAGRAAEEIVFGDITTGAANDLEQATKLARAMVTRYGMSEKLGPMTFGEKQELVFLGKEIGEQREYSEKVAQEIDEEVRRIIQQAYEKAKEILRTHRSKLDRLAQALMEKETLEGEELKVYLN
ncbi:MAG: ATP-dependent zinc metalloprotease FtsH [Anaerolineae bacterium]|nr:ATP-dependent zinc metalloprotease FtsH [Anaerolineae bacterium]MDW8102553.1 ATP-dependent zinc metalloprotease FtsH [Anaerolineae bacterium]